MFQFSKLCKRCTNLKKTNFILWRNTLMLSTRTSFSAMIFRLIIVKTQIKYFAGGICTCDQRLDGKVVIVTGSNSGIGEAVATKLAEKGAYVIVACRNEGEGKKTVERIIHSTNNKLVRFEVLDFTSFISIINFIHRFRKSGEALYALVNNAGVFYHPITFTENGFDVTFQTNYLGPFLLTYSLLKNFKSTRIVNVVSEAHFYCTELDVTNLVGNEGDVGRFLLYAQSKLCLMLLTNKLSRLLQSSAAVVNNANPGNVETRIYRHFFLLNNWFLFALQWPLRLIMVKTPFEGAQTLIHLVSDPALATTTGKYFSDCVESTSSKLSQDTKLADQLWDQSLLWCAPYIQMQSW